MNDTLPRAIAFDAFGTLVEITDRRRPYHRFTRLARGVPCAPDPLVSDIALGDWARLLDASEGDILAAEADLAAEAASVRLRPWVPPAWHRLRDAGIRIGVCSNLATPYGPPLLESLPGRPDATVLSYSCGIKKPDPKIYALMAQGLGLAAGDIMFVGDTRGADHDGPIAAGMRAMPVAEFERAWPELLANVPRKAAACLTMRPMR